MPELSAIGILTVFFAGTISFLSPCVLPLVPGYVSYIAGHTAELSNRLQVRNRWLPAAGLGSCFVLGFSTVFIILGASATALGQMLISYRYELNIVGGAIIILFGLFMLGMAQLSVMQRDFRFHIDLPGGTVLSAYTLGLAFGFGWTPCIGPILGAVLTASAASATVSEGIALLAIYSTGLGVPFILSAIFVDRLANRIRTIGRVGLWLHRSAGVLMIAMGLAMMTGYLTALSYWLLDAFPFLAQIG